MSFRLIGAMIAARLGSSGQKPEELAGPFKEGDLRRLRIGAGVDFSRALGSFVLAEDGGTIFKKPEGTLSVIAHGTIIDANFTTHRFYLGKSSEESEHVLQISVGRDGKPVEGETKIFSKLTEVNPASSEEWDLWFKGMKARKASKGKKAQKAQPPLLGGIKLDWEGNVLYHRIWGSTSDGKGPSAVPPRELRESITAIDGKSVVFANSSSMLYGRVIGEKISEWMHVAALRASGGERWIEAHVGLAISPLEIQAI